MARRLRNAPRGKAHNIGSSLETCLGWIGRQKPVSMASPKIFKSDQRSRFLVPSASSAILTGPATVNSGRGQFAFATASPRPRLQCSCNLAGLNRGHDGTENTQFDLGLCKPAAGENGKYFRRHFAKRPRSWVVLLQPPPPLGAQRRVAPAPRRGPKRRAQRRPGQKTRSDKLSPPPFPAALPSGRSFP